ncbi:MAG: acetyl-CoA C-acetyltransferase [Myxococcota bacterium]|nr:acetyl-CoA C-acetyltransferase [Myxococcota bacterium]
MREVVIVAAVRTPIGSFGGALSSMSSPKLGAAVIKAGLQQARLTPEQVDEVIMGCVLTAGVGQAPARQAALFADLPQSVPCLTINKVCGSGLKAVMLASQAIRCGDADVIIAGGMENMSQVPYLMPGARDGLRLGHKQVLDGMVKDGLWDVYNDYHMGNAAEVCARDMKVDRAAQDAFARSSYEKALAAQAAGAFDAEIVPVQVPQRRGEPIIVDQDEEPGRGRPDKMAKLRPAFEKEGTVTAANASSINDGAAVLVVASAEFAARHNLPVLASLTGMTQHAQAPEWFTTAPAYAMNALLKEKGLAPNDIDLYEVNEAFSVVSLACNTLSDLPTERVNINGGAVALGHPIGASGARILVTLVHAMKNRGAQRGVASLCIGGGEAVAVLIERTGDNK